MASQAHNFISFMFLFVVAVSEVACKRHNSCGLFEYYDKHMDDCGPCQEICDLMEVKGTEKQCKSQCSHYLVAVTCTYTQYYDDVVSSCAPCSELCDLSDVKGTTEECARKCHNYLKAQNCTEKEYFDDKVMECSACSQLCSQQDEHGGTNRDCFIKCHAYIEGHPQGNILKGDSPKDPSHAKSRAGDPAKDDTASMHPGIILTLVIGVIVVAATIGFVVYWVKNRRHVYTPAPSIEANLDEEEKNDDIEQARHAEDSNTESVQHAATQSSQSIRGGRQEGENNGNGMKLAIQERDPKATGGYSFSQVHLTRETVL